MPPVSPDTMVMARDAWNAVEPATIRNCWDHTKSKGKYMAVTETCKITYSSQYRNTAAVRGHPSVSLPSLSSILLHFPLLSHTHSCSYVHSPTLCTITRYQTLEVDDSWTYYCHRHSTPPSALTSGASDRLQTHWDRAV
jgi:hypothetical protein